MIAVTLAQPVSIGLIAILSLGFFLGMRHATDADHVVAISTIVTRERRIGSAAFIGALWGIGHTFTIMAVGIAIVLFTVVIPPRLGLSMEFSVGLMLVVLGVVNLRNFWNGWNGNALGEHIHDPLERGASRQHLFHTHDEPARSVNLMDRALGDWRVYQWARPLIVGLVHGLAGSAAVALLVLATVHNARWAIAYLFLFGLGTIAGMMIITMAIASALHLASRHSAWIHRKLVVTTGLLSVFFGLFIVYQMGYVHGLFTAHPGWTPQ